PAVPLPQRPPRPPPVRGQPAPLLRRDQALVRPVRRDRGRHPAPDRGVPLPPTRPPPRTRQPDRPDPRREAPLPARRRPGRRAAVADRPPRQPAAELLRLRGVSPPPPRPPRPGGRAPLPRPRRRVPPLDPVLRR